MAPSLLHLRHQLPVLRALGQAALARPVPGSQPSTPGPWVETTLPPRAPGLIADYLRHVRARPGGWSQEVPAHLFPQWGFAVLGRALPPLPYDLRRVLNAGFTLTQRAPLPMGQPLRVRARLEAIDDNGTRAILHQTLVTGTADEPDAITCTIQALVPLAKGSGKKDKPRLPLEVREIDRWSLPPRAGFDFAVLTGDFNPVHWILPVARASGFRSTLLHGFSTAARAWESLQRNQLAGTRITQFEAKFTRPLLLPARPGVYVGPEQGFWVGDAPGGPAYLVGHYTLGSHQ